jgi:thiol-disulfide isomerase/thioredoxin
MIKPIPLLVIVYLAFPLQVFASADQKEAIIINASTGDNISLAYQDILLTNSKALLMPGDTLRIVFGENSYRPVTVGFVTSLPGPPALAVLPGDTVTVYHKRKENSYDFKGKNPAELDFFKKLRSGTLRLNGPYYEMLPGQIPANLDAFLSKWHQIRSEGEALIDELSHVGVRPEMEAYLTRELRLRIFSILALPGVYQKNDEPLVQYTPSYRDSMEVYRRYLQNFQTLPPGKSERLLYSLRSFIIYKAINEGFYPTLTVQYEFAKKELTGIQREWVCYSIIANAISLRQYVDSLLSDYRLWSSRDNKFLKKLLGEEVSGVYDLQSAGNDELLTSNKEAVSLSQLFAKHKGKVIYLDLWASWCGPCIEEFPASRKLSQEYAAKGIVVVYLSIDEDYLKWKQAVDRFLADADGQYLFRNAEASKLIQVFEAKSIPRYIIIDRAGKVINSNAPRPSDPRLKKMLVNL